MQKNRNSELGISIIELMVVLVVTAIVVTAAVYQFGNSRNDIARDKIALEFKTSLERARFDSIKRRATIPDSTGNMARVIINNKTSFTVKTDMNLDGTLDSSEYRDVDFSKNSTLQFTNSLNYPVTIYFDYRGYTTVKDTLDGTVTPNFKICNQNCTTETAKNTTVITLSTTGTVINASGGYVIPTLATPTISNVSAGNKVTEKVKVNGNISY